MTKTDKIILSGLAGTSAMTLFSYIASQYEEENLNEPELLAGFIANALHIRKEIASPMGWVAHYSMGIGWAAAGTLLLKLTKAAKTSGNGLLFGALGGITGIIIWNMLFKTHPRPPRTSLKKFYIQLFYAHLVYGLTTTVTQRELSGNEDRAIRTPIV